MKNEDAQIMALQFYSPIYLLLTLCYREPQREEEALHLLEKHIRISVQAMNWAGVTDKKKQTIEKDTTKIANKVLKNNRVKVGLKTKALFMMMRMMQQKGWGSGEAEKEYWEQNGWMGKERPWK